MSITIKQLKEDWILEIKEKWEFKNQIEAIEVMKKLLYFKIDVEVSQKENLFYIKMNHRLEGSYGIIYNVLYNLIAFKQAYGQISQGYYKEELQ